MSDARPIAASRQPTGRSNAQLLFDRTFGPFFWGKLTSAFGMWIQNLTAAVVMFEITDSSLMVATVTIVQFGGPLLLSIYTGALSDRLDRRKLLILGRSCSAGGAGWLAGILFVAGDERSVSLFPVYVGLIALALGLAISSPAMHALIPALVPGEDLDSALALGSITGSLARAVGPAIGGIIIAASSSALAFAVSAALHASFVASLCLIRPVARKIGSASETPAETGIWAGLRYAIRERNIGIMLLGVAALGVGIDPMITLAPKFSLLLVGSTALVGAFASSFGVGAILGVILLRQVRKRHGLRLSGVVGFACLGSGLAVSAVTTVIPVVLCGFLLSGFGFLFGQTALSTRIHRRVPDQLRGRVMALWSVAFLGFRPLGAGMNGAIAEMFTIRHALIASACVAFAAIPLARHSNLGKSWLRE